jgi:glutamine synthetase
MTFLEEYESYSQLYGQPERIELLLCDINAILRGKWLPGDQANKLANGKVRLPLSTYAPNILGLEVEDSGLGIVAGDPDGTVVPIAGTLKPVPWVEGNVAQVLVELTENTGNISSLSPRKQLSNTLEKFSKKGWKPVAAAELEFYVIQPRPSSNHAPNPPANSPKAQNYDMELLQHSSGFLDEILSACEAQGLSTDTLVAEYGPGQFEVNFHHSDDTLDTADTALLFRRIVRGVVANHGMEATFMAKPYRDYPGSGMHLHCSIVNEAGENIFTPDTESEEASPLLKEAVAGVLATMHDAQAVFAPHMNSLRRFGPNSFAPTAPEWGYDHRGAAVRIPEINGAGARLEHRISGADVNPYLATAAILGGMLHGIENKPVLPLPLDSHASAQSKPLTADWSQVIIQFHDSAFAKELLGEKYHHIFTQVKRNELEEISTIISAAEYRYYLSRL